MTLNLDLHKSRLEAYEIGTKDGQISLLKTKLINEFANSPSCVSVIVNGVGIARDFHVLRDGNSPSKKRMNAKPNETMATGDYFYFNNEYWLANSEVDKTNPVYDSIMIRRCNLTPFYYKIGVITYATYGFYDKTIAINEDNQPINLPNDVVLVTIPLDEKIKKNDYFYLFGDNWYERYQVEGIDKSKPGLLVIRAKEYQSEITPQEYYNLDPVSQTDVGSVVVTPSTLSLNVSDTKTLIANVYDKSGILMPAETVVWSSSDTDIASVVEGLTTALTVGNCEIIAKSVTDNTIVGKCELGCLDSGGWF